MKKTFQKQNKYPELLTTTIKSPEKSQKVILGRKSMVLQFHFCHNEDDGHP